MLKGRLCRSTIPVNPLKYNVRKTYNQSEFEQVRTKCKDKQKQYHDVSSKELRELEEEETVYLKEGKYWKKAKVLEKTNEPRSYILLKQNGNKVRRNRRDILTKKGHENEYVSDVSDVDSTDELVAEFPSENNGNENVTRENLPEFTNIVRTRYGRISRKPEHLNYQKLGGE